MTKQYEIYSFSFNNILKYGNITDDLISVSDERMNNVYSKEKVIKKSDSLLIDQIMKVNIDNLPLNQILFNMSFKNTKKEDFNNLAYNGKERGIELNIDGKRIVFRNFIKSDSMARSGKVYFINEYFYDEIYDRISFGLGEGKIEIAKYSSYLGKVASDVTLLPIKFKYGEIVVVDDVKFDYIAKVHHEKDDAKMETTEDIYKVLKEINRPLYELRDIKKRKNNTSESIDEYLTSSLYNGKTSNDLDCNIETWEEECENIGIDVDNNVKALLYEIEERSLKLLRTLEEKLKNTKRESNFIPFYEEKVEELLKRYDDYDLDRLFRYLGELEKIRNNKKIININKDDFYKVSETNYSDGVGFISKEFCEEINKELGFDEDDYKYTFQIRLPFVKGMVHCVDLKQYFKDNFIRDIKGIINFKGNTKKRFKYKNIKMILTLSQFKASKFYNGSGDNLKEYIDKLNEYDYQFGVNVKETKDEYQLNYQALSTIPIKERSIQHIYGHNDNQLKDIFKLEDLKNKMDESNGNDYFSYDLKAINLNPNFYMRTSRYGIVVKNMYESYLKDFFNGKVYVNSVRRYLTPSLKICFDEISHNRYFNKAIYTDYLKNEMVIVPGLNNAGKCLLIRNPHYSRSELYYKEFHNEIKDKYFDKLSDIVIAPASDFCAMRLGGADYDGDEVTVVYDPYIIKYIHEDLLTKFNEYKYDVKEIEALGKKLEEEYTINNIIGYYKRLFINDVGKISDTAFKNSFIAYKPNNNEKEDGNSVFTMLGGQEIDAAKTGEHPEYEKYKDLFSKKRYKDTFGEAFLNTIRKEYNEKYPENYFKYFYNLVKKFEKSDYTYSLLYKILKHYVDFLYDNSGIYQGNNKINKGISDAKQKNKWDYKALKKDKPSDRLINQIATIESVLDYFENDYKSLKDINNKKEALLKPITDLAIDNDLVLRDINKFLNEVFDDKFYKDLFDNKIQPFVFETDKEERRRLLNEILKGINYKFKDETIDSFLDFENGKYNLFYYVMRSSYYSRYSDNEKDLSILFKKQIIKKIDFIELNRSYNKAIEEITQIIINNEINKDYLIANEVFNYFKAKEEYKEFFSEEVMFEDLYYVIKDLMKSKALFIGEYGNKLIDYLGRRNSYGI